MSKGLTVSDTGKCLVKGWCFTTVCQLNAAAITDNQQPPCYCGHIRVSQQPTGKVLK